MGSDRLKNDSLLEQVEYGNLEDIRALVEEGADLECTNCQGWTPLMLACMKQDLWPAARLLIKLGADVNALCPRPRGGGPLHFAARRNLGQTAELLLSHGANALTTDDCHQTALDISRGKLFMETVRKIEDHLCLFSGWLKELYASKRFGVSQLLSREVWVVVLPLSFSNNQRPLELELAIYTNKEDAQPCTVVPLKRVSLEEPNLNQPHPVVIISNIPGIPPYWREWRGIKHSQEATGGQIKFAPLHENEKHQLRQFSDACKGISQVRNPSFGSNAMVPSAPPAALDVEEPTPFIQSPISAGTFGIPKITKDNSACIICDAAPVEGAFAPCGHMIGCMLCMMKMSKAMKPECPICRLRIDQVIRLYPVV